MNQLQITTDKVNLPAKSAEIFKVLDSPFVRDCSDQEIKSTLINDMISAYFKAGFAYPSDADFQLMVDTMVQNVRMEGMGLRLNEIQIAFSRGVMKEYGDYMGLSIVSFTHFIKMYLINNSRLEALRKYSESKEEPKKEPTPKEIFEMGKMNAIKAFLDINAGKSVVLGSVVYDFMDSHNLMKFTPDQKREFMDHAKRLVLSEANARKESEADSIKRNDLRRIIEGINDGSEKSIIISKAKQLALIEFMKALHDQGKKIDDLLIWKE